MAGAGRRSNYRKHLTDHVLNDLPVPTSSQRIAQVQATRGGNQFEILVEGTEHVAILPTKFHKLVWVKRGDYVIVDKADDSLSEGEISRGIRFMIAHILYKEQIKHIKSTGLWPTEFQDDHEGEEVPEYAVEKAQDEEVEKEERRYDGISYDHCDDDADVFINTNRMANRKIQDSESDSDD